MFNRTFIAAYRYNLKKTANAYFERTYLFLSLLAGKFNTFEQMLLTETIISKNNLAHAYFERPYFSKFFGGKIENV